jgi:aminopeptidase N
MALRRRTALPVLFALVLADASLASAQPLPADVVPDQYELRFTLDLQHDTFTGSEQILVNIVKPTTRITLNAAGLTFAQVTIVSDWSSQPATVSVDERRETASFTVRRRLPAGPARIRIDYSGRLGGKPRGLFVGRANGRKFAASQFEPTDARRAYACFDQPDMKASFLVTVVAPAADAIISNGRMLSDTPGPESDQHTVKFATTRKMSTYLVALAVGEFDCLEAPPDPLPLRGCALGGKKALAQFALDAARSFLRFYDGYFTVKYPFSKLDLVALPDFPGGMENVGAIFFGERDLLVDAQAAPVGRQKQVVMTIAHEIAHEWIGDLVTMKWWDDLWLKEGFATFFETRPIQAWKPEWRIELDEVASAEQAMALDEVEATHAARVKVTTPAEINDAYDAIVYQKAGAVLRMAEAAMGRDAFRAGINAFIKRYSYSNATAEDFWSVMAENDVRGVDQVLRTFIDQPGVPVVSITTRCVTDATSSLALAQQRFWIDPKRAAGSPPLWAIPVSTRPIAPQPGVPALSTIRLFASREQTFDLAGCNPLVLGNAEASGYFRTRYPPEVLARVTKEVVRLLTPVERLRLLDDQWALAHAGGLEVGQYLSLLSGYSSERNAQILERVGETLRAIGDDLTTDANRQAFEGWVRQLFAPAAQLSSRPEGGNLLPPAGGQNATDGNEISRREADAALLDILGDIGGDADVRARAHAAIMGEATSVADDPALLDVFSRLAAQSGNAAVLERMTANIEHASSPPVYDRNVQALGYFTGPALVRSALEYALSEHVQAADVGDVLASALANAAARPTAWAFVKSHWKDIVAKTGADEAVTAIVKAASGFCDAAMRDEVQTFFGGAGLGSSAALRQTLERIQTCVDFRAAQRENLARWLAASAPKPPGSP